ncbi:MAG: efflux transporter outer membrane subunit [Marinobacter sp.]|uniref:efflux transporter outer membrane subunit n=1 Tax=Marinobacter sp. TaxID=50741 RepID=UPI00299D9820|nr:efflux transporter outer membrane subunit [Marinobacter sp.]MDX1757407.1 efflux transporter outer membrane subunit [Marinobacter sp.]
MPRANVRTTLTASIRSHLAAGCLALLAGCAVGPDYQPPELDAPAQFSAEHNAQPFDQTQEARFWDGFGDPLLAELIGQSLTANLDLQAALTRYQRAEALLRGSRSEQLPTVGLGASAAAQHLPEVDRLPGADEDIERYRIDANASWELDLFGRLRRASEAQGARLQATEAELAALRVALVGQLASSYFELRGLQQQLDVAQRNVALQQDSLAIVSARLDAGRSTDFDVLRARAQLASTRADIPQLQAEIRVRMHRLAVLTGQSPGALIDRLSPATALPAVTPSIPAGSPGEALRRRPDIRQAERQLAAATADIGVATADLFPRFSLDALLGTVALDGGDLFTGGAESRRVALGIDWTFLNFGRVRARIDAEDADARAALAEYRQVVLEALEETENRLVRYRRAQQRSAELAEAAGAAHKAVQLARTRYEQGYVGYFEVLDAERERLANDNALTQSRTATVLAMVDLYRTLAGAPDRPHAANHATPARVAKAL